MLVRTMQSGLHRADTHGFATCNPLTTRTIVRPCRIAACYATQRPARQRTPVNESAHAVATQRTVPARQLEAQSTKRSVVLLGVLGLTMASTAPAFADETLSPALMDAFGTWLDTIESLGPLGPLAFIFTISIFECIPLFPTQPLSLGSGLLFGAPAGAACTVVGCCTAATLAFTLARTVGRGLAERVIRAEGADSNGAGAGDGGGAVADRLSAVQRAVENGTPLQQFTAILLLRLTPVVPFSASNYVLGLSPVTYPPFLAATFCGMLVWSTVFASLGAVGRQLLKGGMDIDAVMSQVGAQAGDVSEKVLVAAVGVAALFVAARLLNIPSPIPGNETVDGRTGDDAVVVKRREKVQSRD